MPSLIQSAFDGPLDIVGDIHGEIDPLRNLLKHLGYDDAGRHPTGRRLVFLGDLTDRGPDSPAVVEIVARYVETGIAQSILGNHELNILRRMRKSGNGWFFGETETSIKFGQTPPQRLADEATRERIWQFFHRLPLALERDGLRIVHACWDSGMIDIARESTDVVSLYNDYRADIECRLDHDRVVDADERHLARQNGNPTKVLTCGWKIRVKEPLKTSAKVRYEGPVPWWEKYQDEELCVFGHYSHLPPLDGEPADPLFTDLPLNAALGNGNAVCIDYGIVSKWKERLDGRSRGAILGALRFPERTILLDDGTQMMVQ
jgi:hypothetical protein